MQPRARRTIVTLASPSCCGSFRPSIGRDDSATHKGYVHMIVEGEWPLLPDLITTIVARGRAGPPQWSPHSEVWDGAHATPPLSLMHAREPPACPA